LAETMSKVATLVVVDFFANFSIGGFGCVCWYPNFW
jgi:hypothetical protein